MAQPTACTLPGHTPCCQPCTAYSHRPAEPNLLEACLHTQKCIRTRHCVRPPRNRRSGHATSPALSSRLNAGSATPAPGWSRASAEASPVTRRRMHTLANEALGRYGVKVTHSEVRAQRQIPGRWAGGACAGARVRGCAAPFCCALVIGISSCGGKGITASARRTRANSAAPPVFFPSLHTPPLTTTNTTWDLFTRSRSVSSPKQPAA